MNAPALSGMANMKSIYHKEIFDYNRIREIYCDGGLMKENPSLIGGSWAWVGVDENRRLLIARADVVLVTPGGIISNNTVETMAIVKALQAMPDDWDGTIISDSDCALTRTFGNPPFSGCPRNVKEALQDEVLRMGDMSMIHVHGHPNQDDLDGVNGFCEKTGLPLGHKTDKNGNLLPVSMWNKYADSLCRTVMSEYLEKISMKTSTY